MDFKLEQQALLSILKLLVENKAILTVDLKNEEQV